MPDPTLIDSKDAAKALQDYFLANADRGDNAANDELVDALVGRIRARRFPVTAATDADDTGRRARDWPSA